MKPQLVAPKTHDTADDYLHETGSYEWLGSLVVRALNVRLDGREFNSRPPRLTLGWVTVFGRANHLSISPVLPGELSLLP